MTFEELLHFVDELPKRMQHIYLPLLIGQLVDSGGSATLRQLSGSVLAQDESQLQYYEKRLKEMPLKVLRKHGIINTDGNLISLNVKKLTFEQKSHLKMLCEKGLREFIVKKGVGIWDYRLSEKDSSVTGFNVGMNCGDSAGQTIFHCHIHLIPRRNGDTPSPRGGVRGVIPTKMGY